MTIMTPSHERWNEFCSRLSNLLDHFRCDAISTKWAGVILDEMGFTAKEIQASREYFRDHGGFCDCEILMNVRG